MHTDTLESHLGIGQPTDDTLSRLKGVSEQLRKDRPGLQLLALFQPDAPSSTWDLVVQAAWGSNERLAIMRDLASRLRAELLPEEMTGIARIVLLSDATARLTALVKSADLPFLIASPFTFNGVRVLKAIIIYIAKPTPRKHRASVRGQ